MKESTEEETTSLDSQSYFSAEEGDSVSYVYEGGGGSVPGGGGSVLGGGGSVPGGGGSSVLSEETVNSGSTFQLFDPETKPVKKTVILVKLEGDVRILVCPPSLNGLKTMVTSIAHTVTVLERCVSKEPGRGSRIVSKELPASRIVSNDVFIEVPEQEEEEEELFDTSSLGSDFVVIVDGDTSAIPLKPVPSVSMVTPSIKRKSKVVELVPSVRREVIQNIPSALIGVVKVRCINLSAKLSGFKLEGEWSGLEVSSCHKEEAKNGRKWRESSIRGRMGQASVSLLEEAVLEKQLVVKVNLGRSKSVVSTHNLGREGNLVQLSVGPINVDVPEHPITLHGMVTRSSRLLSDTIQELRSNQPSSHSTGSHLDPGTPLVQVSSIKNSSSTGIKNSSSSVLRRERSVEVGKRKLLLRSLVVQFEVSLESFSISASLLPSLRAEYKVGQVVSSGKTGTRAKFSLAIKEHNLTFDTKVVGSNLPSEHVSLPPIHVLADQIEDNRRDGFKTATSGSNVATSGSNVATSGSNVGPSGSNVGPNVGPSGSNVGPNVGPSGSNVGSKATAFGSNVGPNVGSKATTSGCSKSVIFPNSDEIKFRKGSYLNVKINIDSFEHSLTTALLNHLLLVQNVFVKEVNEILLKISGGDHNLIIQDRTSPLDTFIHSHPDGTPLDTSFIHSHPDGTPLDTSFIHSHPNGYLLFNLHLRLQGFRITATTPTMSAVRLELGTLDVHLSNRIVSSINSVESEPIALQFSISLDGITIGAALLPTLRAQYKIGQVTSSGTTGSKAKFVVDVPDHHLSFDSNDDVPVEAKLPSSASVSFPAIHVSAEYLDDPNEDSDPKVPMAEVPMAEVPMAEVPMADDGIVLRRGSYLNALAEIEFFDHSLTTDLLNHMILAQKVLMKEVNEVVQHMMTEGVTKSVKSEQVRSRQGKYVLFTLDLHVQGIQITATTPTNNAFRLETGSIDLQLSNRVQNMSINTQGNDSFSLKLFVKLQVDLSISLGQLFRNPIFEEAEPEFQQLAYFKTRIVTRNALQVKEIPGIVYG